MVKVLELDDGSGWIKVASTRGQSGLVPASYIEFVDSGAVSGTPDSTQKGSDSLSWEWFAALTPFQCGRYMDINPKDRTSWVSPKARSSN